MDTMKAVICRNYGPPDVLNIVNDYARPVPKSDEVLIHVYAASVTDSDIFIRSSRLPLPMLIPFRIMMGITRPRKEILGEVLSGEIVATGSGITRFQVGDQVFGLTGFSLGAYADYTCMKEKDSKRGCIALKPNNISFEDATSAAYGGLLALQFLEKGDIRPNRNVLVYGASGTSGTIAVQYAKHRGAHVTGVCGAGHMELVKSLGADKVLDYSKEESIAELDTYDFILDAVGKRRTSALKKACVKALAPAGKYVSIDDEALRLDSARLDRIRELVESGGVKPITDSCFTFDHIVDAHTYVELGHKTGNVAITVNRKP